MDNDKGNGHGVRSQGANGAVGSVGEDIELQKIFDELFEDFDFPVDVDRFCNEVIEEGFAETADAPGTCQVGTAQQEQTQGGNGGMSTADGQSVQGPDPAQMVIHRQERQQQCIEQQHFRVGGGAHAVGRGATAETALSPHNYYLRPPPVLPPPPSSSCATSVSTSNSDSQLDNGSSPTYQKVPHSPCLSLSQHPSPSSSSVSFVDEFAQIHPERDPMLCSIKQERISGHFADSPSFGLEEPIDGWMDHSQYPYSMEEQIVGEDGEQYLMGNSHHHGSMITDDQHNSFPTDDLSTFLSY